MALSDSDPSKSETKLLCENCDTRFENKELLTEHLKTHSDVPKKVFYCDLCNIRFGNKGLLGCHMSKKHNIISNAKTKNNNTVFKKRPKYTKTCGGCKKTFRYKCQLEYHIRKTHYNLISKPPYFHLQDINETWYEKVFNTNMYAELKKFDCNTLFIRKVEGTVTPFDMPRDLIDLRVKYPTESSMKWFPCVVCSKFFSGKDLYSHVNDNHSLVKELCMKCNCWFKPLTKELNHVCPV